MKNYFKKKHSAFTIVELIMIVGIIVIVFAGFYTVFNPTKRLGQANDARRWTDITAIAKAVEAYSIDNHAIPSDFSTSTLSVGEKFVLCTAEGVNTCDGQTKGCLVVDDADFLGVFLPSLPIDPDKTADTDTGYYVTRTSSGAMSFGACATYGSDTINSVAKATLPTLVANCGDGYVEGSETCDDGNDTTEACGDGTQQTGSDYCNSTCSATYAGSEACDDWDQVTEACGDGEQNYGTFCNADCSAELELSETCDF